MTKRALGSLPGRGPLAGAKTCRRCRVRRPVDAFVEPSRVCLVCRPADERDDDAAQFRLEQQVRERQRREDEQRERDVAELLRKNREEVLSEPLPARNPVQLQLPLECPEERVLGVVRRHPCWPTRRYGEALDSAVRRVADLLRRLELDRLVVRYVDVDPGHGARVHWDARAF